MTHQTSYILYQQLNPGCLQFVGLHLCRHASLKCTKLRSNVQNQIHELKTHSQLAGVKPSICLTPCMTSDNPNETFLLELDVIDLAWQSNIHTTICKANSPGSQVSTQYHCDDDVVALVFVWCFFTTNTHSVVASKFWGIILL